jgi:hypothetical protein
MSGRPWAPGNLSPGGQAVYNRLTGRQMSGMAPAPQPQPLGPVIGDLVGEDEAGAPDGVAEQLADHQGRLDALNVIHTPGHPHMDGHANQLAHPDNPLSRDDWDGE